MSQLTLTKRKRQKKEDDTTGDQKGTGRQEKAKTKRVKKAKHPLQLVHSPMTPDGWWGSDELWELKPIELDRLRGAVRGAIMGDSLGVPHEFPRWMKCKYTGKCEHRFTIRVGERYGHPPKTLAPGCYSDDTEMMLCIMRSLVENKGFDKTDVVERYIRWTHSDQPSIGSNTRDLFKINTKTKKDPTGIEHYDTKFRKVTGLSNYKVEWDSRSESFQSDGSLMRCAPLALLPTREAIEKAVKHDVWCSNPSQLVLSIEMIHVWIVRQAMQGTAPRVIWNHLMTDIVPTLVDEKLRTIITDVDSQLKETQAHINKGWLMHGFVQSLIVLKKQAAPQLTKASGATAAAVTPVKSIQTLTKTDYKTSSSSHAQSSVVSKTTRPSEFMDVMKWVIADHPISDTDTNACIVGGVIGALEGWTRMNAHPLVAHNWPIIVHSTSDESDTEVPRTAEYQIGDLDTVEQQLHQLSQSQDAN